MGVNHTDQSHIKTHDYSNPCHDDDDTDASIAHPFVTTHHDQINDHSSIKQEINGLIRTDDPASILITSQATRDYLANNRDSSRLATSNGDGISLKHTADQFVMLDNGTEINHSLGGYTSTDLSLWSSATDYKDSPLDQQQQHQLMAKSTVRDE